MLLHDADVAFDDLGPFACFLRRTAPHADLVSQPNGPTHDREAYDALKLWDFVDLVNATDPGTFDRAFTADICGDASTLPDKVNDLLTNQGLGGYCQSFTD